MDPMLGARMVAGSQTLAETRCSLTHSGGQIAPPAHLHRSQPGSHLTPIPDKAPAVAGVHLTLPPGFLQRSSLGCSELI